MEWIILDIEVVIFSKNKSQVDFIVKNDSGIIFNKTYNMDKGLNFINNNLYDKDNKKYIGKGEYIIQVKNNISSNENKLIIN